MVDIYKKLWWISVSPPIFFRSSFYYWWLSLPPSGSPPRVLGHHYDYAVVQSPARKLAAMFGIATRSCAYTYCDELSHRMCERPSNQISEGASCSEMGRKLFFFSWASFSLWVGSIWRYVWIYGPPPTFKWCSKRRINV